MPCSRRTAAAMGRELRRLVVAPARLRDGASPLLLEPDERHYLSRVLRLGLGGRFAIADGAGRLWTARLAEAGAELEQPLDAPLEHQNRPEPRITLAVALPRRDGESLVRMACELGVDGLLPLQAERSQRGGSLRPERLAVILREAVEQCERLWLPELEAAQAPADLFKAAAAGVALLATTRAQELPLLDQELAMQWAERPALVQAGVTLAIGPEGGWSPAEEAAAMAAGWRPVSLGPTILRVSTAAVAGSAALVRWRLGLTCRSCSEPSP